jgi:hypothetical protein
MGKHGRTGSPKWQMDLEGQIAPFNPSIHIGQADIDSVEIGTEMYFVEKCVVQRLTEEQCHVLDQGEDGKGGGVDNLNEKWEIICI